MLFTGPAQADPPSINACKANDAVTTYFTGYQQLQRNKICIGKRYGKIFAFWQAQRTCAKCPHPDVLGHFRLALYRGSKLIGAGPVFTNPNPPYQKNVAHKYLGAGTYSLVVQEQIPRGGKRVWHALETSPKCLNPFSSKCKPEDWIVQIRV